MGRLDLAFQCIFCGNDDLSEASGLTVAFTDCFECSCGGTVEVFKVEGERFFKWSKTESTIQAFMRTLKAKSGQPPN